MKLCCLGFCLLRGDRRFEKPGRKEPGRCQTLLFKSTKYLDFLCNNPPPSCYFSLLNLQMLLQDIFKLIIVSVFFFRKGSAGCLQIPFVCVFLENETLLFCSQQCEATTRTLHRPSRGSTTSLVQRVRIGVRLEMIKMVRMMRGAGVWRVPGAMGTGGALRAQVGKAQRTLTNCSDVVFKVAPFFFFFDLLAT